MTIQNLRPNRQLFVALVTLTVVAVLFAYYFLVHTKKQESRIISQAFNNLNTLSLGFQDNLESHRTAIENLLKGNSELLFSTYDSLYEEYTADYKSESENLRSKMFGSSKNADYRRQYYSHISSRREIENKVLEDLRNAIPETDAYKLVDIQRVRISNKNDTTSGVQIHVGNGNITFTATIKSNVKETKLPLKLRFNTDLEDFISSTFNHRIFKEFILISNDSMVYQTMDYKFKKFKYDTLKKLNREINYLNNIVQKFANSGSASNVITDETLVSKALSASNLYDINISKTQYKLFLNQFEVNGVYWVLGGFMSTDLYNQQKRSVEPTILLVAITVLLFILLASQLIKLFILSEFEQFFIRNIIISVISITVGSSILVTGLMSTISYWIKDRSNKDIELEVLNDNIKSSFSNELGEIISFIQSCDSTLSENDWINPPVRWPRQDFLDSFKIQNRYKEKFDNTYWISNQGDEMIQVFESTKPVSYLNLKGREYFRSIRDERGYVYSNSSLKSSIRFFFQPLKSWVTGKKTVVVSLKSSGAELNQDTIPIVAAMATQFRSLQNCFLPYGYGFALIDANGKVLFHDDDRLSLSENFLQECSEVDEIKSAIIAGTVSTNSVNYHNKKIRIYLSPIENMPLYLLTYHDRELFRLPGVLIFYYTILFSLIGLISVGFWIVFLSIFNYHSSKLKFRSLILKWAIPDNNKLSWYWKTTIVNLIAVCIICIAEIFFSKTLTNKFLLLFLACNFIFPVNYFMLKKCSELELEKLGFIEFVRIGIKDNVFRAFMVILLAFNLFIWLIDYSLKYSLLIYQASLMLLIFVPFILNRIKILNTIYQRLVTIKLAHAYTAFTISWLTLVSILPTIFYFNVAHENELKIWKKFDQLQLVREIHKRKNAKIDPKKVDRGIYLVLNEDSKYDKNDQEFTAESKLINSIFYHLRLPIGQVSDLTKSFVSDNLEKSQKWFWDVNDEGDPKSLNASYLYLGNRANVKFQRPPNLSLDEDIKAKYPPANKGHLLYVVIILIVLFILLVLNYYMLYYLLNKIFGFNFLISKSLVSSSREQIISAVRRGNDIFIVGLPAPDFNALRKEIQSIEVYDGKSIDDQPNSSNSKSAVKELYLDLQDRHNTKPEGLDLVDKDLVLIDHFEYSCNDIAKLRQNLSFIEFIKNKGKQIVIFSNVSPRQIERIYNQFGKSSIVQDPIERAGYLNDEDLWSKLLNSFHVLHYQLAPYKIKPLVTANEKNPLKKQLANLIEKELGVSTYFKKIEYLVVQKYRQIVNNWQDKELSQNDIETLKEEMILYIQDIAQSYYFSLWNTCYKKQRFLLYDLAYDNIANFKDGATVLFLMKKGILKFDNGIHIMNDSFRHFVIDAIGEEDALAMRREMERKGTWSSAKMVLIIVAVSLVIFIFMVNKGSVNQLSAIITGIVALVGALFRLISFGAGSSPSGGK